MSQRISKGRNFSERNHLTPEKNFVFDRNKKYTHNNEKKPENFFDYCLSFFSKKTQTISYDEEFTIKPSGLWYQIEDSNFTQFPDMIFGNYSHSLEVNMEKILLIDTVEKLKNFLDKYKKICPYNDILYIDWDKVYKDYNGIEFRNYYDIKTKVKSHHYVKYMWFYTIDLDSGCIWNLQSIEDCKFHREILQEELDKYQIY